MYFGKDDIMSYEEFYTIYEQDLENQNMSEECLKNCIDMLEYNKEHKENIYKSYIEKIYIGIIHIKYLKSFDTELLCDLISGIIYLKNDYDLNKNKSFYNINKLCKEVYETVYELYKDILDKNANEDFNPNNIMNLNFYLNEILKLNTEFNSILNNEIWRNL